MLQARAQIVTQTNEERRNSAKGQQDTLDAMSKEIQIQLERKTLPEFQPILSQHQRSPKWYHLAIMKSGRTLDLSGYKPIL